MIIRSSQQELILYKWAISNEYLQLLYYLRGQINNLWS